MGTNPNPVPRWVTDDDELSAAMAWLVDAKDLLPFTSDVEERFVQVFGENHHFFDKEGTEAALEISIARVEKLVQAYQQFKQVDYTGEEWSTPQMEVALKNLIAAYGNEQIYTQVLAEIDAHQMSTDRMIKFLEHFGVQFEVIYVREARITSSSSSPEESDEPNQGSTDTPQASVKGNFTKLTPEDIAQIRAKVQQFLAKDHRIRDLEIMIKEIGEVLSMGEALPGVQALENALRMELAELRAIKPEGEGSDPTASDNPTQPVILDQPNIGKKEEVTFGQDAIPLSQNLPTHSDVPNWAQMYSDALAAWKAEHPDAHVYMAQVQEFRRGSAHSYVILIHYLIDDEKPATKRVDLTQEEVDHPI